MPDLALEAIDPEWAHREWVREFEWHLDQVPGLIETLGLLAAPRLPVQQLDRPRVSGGGYVDNVPVNLSGTGDARDARALWSLLSEYCRATAEWLAEDSAWPAELPGDPRAARDQVLLAVGWLIDRAEAIESIGDVGLEAFRELLFSAIRRARARARAAGTRRRSRPRTCVVCKSSTVVIDWSDRGGSGRARPVGRCSMCGQVYTVGGR
jgi:hypothetical protein